MQKQISTLVGIIVIVAVAIVLFGGVFAYQYFTKSQININDQTSGPALSEVEGWKTYTSNELKYSFKYPSNWKVVPNYAYSAAGAGGIVGYIVTTSNSKTPPDNERIDIGGAQVDCVSLSNLNRQEHPAGVLCKTNYPVYTFSTNSNVISVFNVIANSISDIKFPASMGQTTSWKTYTNTQYGFEFKYPKKLGDRNVTVMAEGKKVYVDGKNGQSVEIFSKNINETFENAIKRIILNNFPSPSCKIEIREIPENDYHGKYQKAEISYPPATNPANGFWENAGLCNSEYDKTNGIRYFIYDTSVPDKFAFFSIGQYAIPVGEGNSILWQDTFKFIK